jgi:zinc protease
MTFVLRLFARWLLPLLLAAAAAAQPLQPVRTVEGITEYRLSNGLQLLLAPDDSKPTTTVNLTIRVGSRHENYGETGMAHLLEHLMFKGTPRHQQVWSEFTQRGLRANGTTSLDRTNYFASFAASDDNLAWVLDWLGDALVNSFIARKDLDTEMTVVRNEMEMGENSPGRILFERVLASMYQWHNYGKSTIGARADVEQVDIGRLQAFYRTWYQPDNATLIVSGRFESAGVLALVQRHFGGLPKPARELPRLYTLDPVQDGEREVTLRRVGGAPALMVGYHGVPGAHPDQAAAELLVLVMGDAPAGRLHRRLTEAGLAATTWGWTPTLHDPGYLMFGAELAPGQEVGPARAALIATLESAAAQPVTTDEVERARTKWLTAWEQQYSDPERVGVALSEFVGQGDWRLLFLLRDRVRDVPVAEVQRFATERLLPANRTVGTFVPTEAPRRAPPSQAVDVAAQMAGFRPGAASVQAEAFEATPQNIDARTQRGRSSGLQWALLPKATRGQTVSASLRLQVGDAASLNGYGEVGALYATMLDKGTTTLDRQQLRDRLDALKAEVGFVFGNGVLSVTLQARRGTLPETIELVGQMLRQPALDAAALDELKRQSLAALEQQRREPDAIVATALARHGNPYRRGDLRHARTVDEAVEDVKAVSVERLREFQRRFMGASRAAFAAVGDFDAAAARAALDKALAGWQAPVSPVRVEQPLWAGPPARLAFATPDKQNAVLMVRQPLALSDRDPDYAAMMVANRILGGGGDSRLWKRIREAEGLSYDVGSWIQWSPYEPHSPWHAIAIFAPANRARVEAALAEEIARAWKEGFTPAELRQAVQGLLNQRRLARAQDPVLAATLAAYLDLGRTMAASAQVDAALGALTAEQVSAALRRHLRAEAFVAGVGGDFKD